MRSLSYGVVAGGIGALVWAAIAYLANYEVGWVAWGIGWLVGSAVAIGNADGSRAPASAGAIAVFLAALAVLGGKYGTAWAMVPHGESLVDTLATSYFDDEEFLISYVADDVVVEFQADGRTLTWPAGANRVEPTSKLDYPTDVWAEAARRWSTLSGPQRTAFREAREASFRGVVTENLPDLRRGFVRAAFLDSFAPLDLLFVGLAVFTAFRVGSGTNPPPDETGDLSQDDAPVTLGLGGSKQSPENLDRGSEESGPASDVSRER